jgi:hypothetical protein
VLDGIKVIPYEFSVVLFSIVQVLCCLVLSVVCRLEMKDRKGVVRGKCKKCGCDEYTMEKILNLCAFCDHTPFAHGMFL